MRREKGKFGEIVIEITPLVDVVFLLLLFFVLTTTFNVEEKSIDVKLPKAISGVENTKTNIFVIFVDSKDNVIIDGKGVSMDNLSDLIEKMKEEHKFTKAVIKADERSHHGVVVRIMDSLRMAGIYDIKLAVKR